MRDGRGCALGRVASRTGGATDGSGGSGQAVARLVGKAVAVIVVEVVVIPIHVRVVVEDEIPRTGRVCRVETAGRCRGQAVAGMVRVDRGCGPGHGRPRGAAVVAFHMRLVLARHPARRSRRIGADLPPRRAVAQGKPSQACTDEGHGHRVLLDGRGEIAGDLATVVAQMFGHLTRHAVERKPILQGVDGVGELCPFTLDVAFDFFGGSGISHWSSPSRLARRA